MLKKIQCIKMACLIALLTMLPGYPFHTKPRVAVLYIATGRYINFWDGFYESMEKNFLPGVSKTYFIWTDDLEKKFPSNVVRIYQKQLPWPGVTLKRYHFFHAARQHLKEYDYLYFLNANMHPVRSIGEEIFPNREQKVMVTLHPGYYGVKVAARLPYDRNLASRAYVPHNKGKFYFMGGFNGGRSKDFLKMAKELMLRVEDDEKRGVVASWHDESHLNRYMIDYMSKGGKPLILMPSYGMPEEALVGGYENLNEFKDAPHQIILNKKKFGGHKWLREGQTGLTEM